MERSEVGIGSCATYHVVKSMKVESPRISTLTLPLRHIRLSVWRVAGGKVLQKLLAATDALEEAKQQEQECKRQY